MAPMPGIFRTHPFFHSYTHTHTFSISDSLILVQLQFYGKFIEKKKLLFLGKIQMDTHSHTLNTILFCSAGIGWPKKNVCKLCDANEYWLLNCIGHGNGRYRYILWKIFCNFQFIYISIYIFRIFVFSFFVCISRICLLLH